MQRDARGSALMEYEKKEMREQVHCTTENYFLYVNKTF